MVKTRTDQQCVVRAAEQLDLRIEGDGKISSAWLFAFATLGIAGK
jgi:hypothetical protein